MYPRRSKKPHPADLAHAAQVARAVSYSVHFRKGPFEKYQVAAATLDAARAAAAELDAAHGAFGRRAIVYAITPEGASYPVSAAS